MSSIYKLRGSLRLVSKQSIRLNSTKSETIVESVSEIQTEPPATTLSTNTTTATTTAESLHESENDLTKSKTIKLNANGQPFSSAIEELSEMTKSEFEMILNSAPRPTLNRDEVLFEKFQKLLKIYGNKDNLKKQFTSSSSLLAKFPNLIPSDNLSSYTDVELVVRQKHHAEIMGELGSKVINVYKPHTLISNPPNPNEVTIKKLLSSGAHLGRSKKLFKHSNQPFIYGEYKGIHIIDLEKTTEYLKNASKVVEKVSENGGLILFLGLKVGQLRAVSEAAKRCNGYYVTRKWIPGTITNSLENPKPRHEVDMENLKTNRELTGDELNKVVKPDLIVILNPESASVAIKEANQARIPTIGIIDTNTDPSLVTYPIPANSSSGRTTNLICGVLSKAGELGLKRRLQKVKEYKKTLGMLPEETFGVIDEEIDDFENENSRRQRRN